MESTVLLTTEQFEAIARTVAQTANVSLVRIEEHNTIELNAPFIPLAATIITTNNERIDVIF